MVIMNLGPPFTGLPRKVLPRYAANASPGPALAHWRPCSQWCIAKNLGARIEAPRDYGVLEEGIGRQRILGIFQGLRSLLETMHY